MTSFKWCPCSGTGRSVGCNRLVLSLDLITGMPAFVTDAYISNGHLDKAIPVIKTKPQNNSAGTYRTSIKAEGCKPLMIL